MAVVEPDVLGGSEPVVRGTRVPVRDVAAAVVAGLPAAEILASYPGLQAEQVELAALYASVERPMANRVVRWRGACRPARVSLRLAPSRGWLRQRLESCPLPDRRVPEC